MTILPTLNCGLRPSKAEMGQTCGNGLQGFVNEVDSDMVLFAGQKVAEVYSVLQNSGLQQF